MRATTCARLDGGGGGRAGVRRVTGGREEASDIADDLQKGRRVGKNAKNHFPWGMWGEVAGIQAADAMDLRFQG